MALGGWATLPWTMWTESMKWGQEQFERVDRWADISFRVPDTPAWATPNEIVWETSCLKLRSFSIPEEVDAAPSTSSVHRTPVLIVTPQINHSFICDYTPKQSLVRTFQKAGFTDVYCTEWKSATLDRADETLDAILYAIEQTIDQIGEPVHLVGLCQGGWMSLIHSALEPKQVRSVTLAAAPVDFHASPGSINWTAFLTPMWMYKAYVAMGGGVMRGEMMRLGFNNLRPMERYLGNYLTVWAKIDDPAFLERYRRLQDWYNLPQHLPGASYLKIVRDLFKQNRLIKGTLKCRDRLVDLSQVVAPLYMIAGERDHITPRKQLFAAEKYVSSSAKRQYVADAGHIGVFMGSRSLRDVWPVVFRDMLEDCGENDIERS